MAIIDPTHTDYLARIEGIMLLVNSAYENVDLSRERIENNVFLGRFNTEVAIMVPGYTSLASDSDYLGLLKNAVQLLTSAELLSAEDTIKREDVEGEQVEYSEKNIQALISDRRNQADRLIRKVAEHLGGSNQIFPQVVFKVINPRKRI